MLTQTKPYSEFTVFPEIRWKMKMISLYLHNICLFSTFPNKIPVGHNTLIPSICPENQDLRELKLTFKIMTTKSAI